MPDVYNSAYTGTQIDAAIGAVRNKEEVWDAKQSKLTGSPGQVVGFDDEGDAIATPAPSGLPDGATEGQMLYQGATGPEWGIPPYLESIPQLTSAQMKSLHALGITDLDDVTEPGTYVGMGDESTNYPTISNVPSEVGPSPFILNLYLLIAPTDSDYSGNNVAIQVCFGLLPVMNGKAKTWYRTAQLASTTTGTFWSDWSLAASIASSTEFVPTSPLTSDNVQDAIEEVQGNIPTNYVPTSRTVNGKALSADIELDAEDVGARPDNWTPSAADVGAVPTSRTVNGKALSNNINLSASDVGARANTWMPSAADVGARPDTWMPDADDVGALPTSGGTLTGPLTLSGAPTGANQAATKAYVDGKAALVFTNISVTTSMTWGTHSVTEVNDQKFTQRVTVPISGVTVNHIPLNINFDVTSRYNGNWSDYCETYNGGLYLYAKEAMAATIESATFVDSQS